MKKLGRSHMLHKWGQIRYKNMSAVAIRLKTDNRVLGRLVS